MFIFTYYIVIRSFFYFIPDPRGFKLEDLSRQHKAFCLIPFLDLRAAGQEPVSRKSRKIFGSEKPSIRL